MNILFPLENNINIKIPVPKNRCLHEKRFSNTPLREALLRLVVTEFINAKLIKGNIIDCGAHIGDNSVPWAKLMKNNFIYAVDPSANNIKYIKELCNLNNLKNIKLLQYAISNCKKDVYTNGNIDHCSFRSGQKKMKLKSTSFDNLFDDNKISNIDFIHLDVEGLEEDVIVGSKKIINFYKPIIIFEQHISGRNNDNYIKLCDYLKNTHNYRNFMLNEQIDGCWEDCRNLLSIHPSKMKNINSLINKLNIKSNNNNMYIKKGDKNKEYIFEI